MSINIFGRPSISIEGSVAKLHFFHIGKSCHHAILKGNHKTNTSSEVSRGYWSSNSLCLLIGLINQLSGISLMLNSEVHITSTLYQNFGCINQSGTFCSLSLYKSTFTSILQKASFSHFFDFTQIFILNL